MKINWSYWLIVSFSIFFVFNSLPAQNIDNSKKGLPLIENYSNKTEEQVVSGSFNRSFWGTVIPMTSGIVLVTLGTDGTSGTILFGTLFWGGALFGPSWGYFHSDNGIRGLKGILLRSSIFTVAYMISPTKDFNDGIFPNPDLDNMGIWAAATLIIFISDGYDIAKVKAYARQGKLTLTPQFNRASLSLNLTLKL